MRSSWVPAAGFTNTLGDNGHVVLSIGVPQSCLLVKHLPSN
jgi:hypothetical protein